MTPDPLDLAATPERLHALAAAGLLNPPELERVLSLSVATPDKAAWRRFLSWVLLGLGSMLVLSGVIFFFAYNWAALHRFGKLGLLLAAIVAACVAAWHLGEAVASQFALLFAAVLVGPLLAVYGQSYQTGADAYELFLGWSLLVLPWVVLARFSPLWLLLLLLVNTGLSLFWNQVVEGETQTLTLLVALLNGGAWMAHELFAARGVLWLRGRWLSRVLAVMTVSPLLALSEELVLSSSDSHPGHIIALGLLLAVMGVMYLFHRRVRSDLFFLTLDALCVMTLVTSAIGRALFESSGSDTLGVFFLMSLIIIGEVGLAVWWLRVENRHAPEVES